MQSVVILQKIITFVFRNPDLGFDLRLISRLNYCYMRQVNCLYSPANRLGYPKAIAAFNKTIYFISLKGKLINSPPSG
jgi:hypothetical protein